MTGTQKQAGKKRHKGIDATIVVALITLVGVIITALLTSPILLSLIQQTSTPAPTSTAIVSPAPPTVLPTSTTFMTVTPSMTMPLPTSTIDSLIVDRSSFLHVLPIWSQCKTKVLPQGVELDREDSEKALTQLQAAMDTNFSGWNLGPDVAEHRVFDADFTLRLDLTSVVSATSWIRIDNPTSVSVFVEQAPEQSQLVQVAECGGAGNIRTFPVIDLVNTDSGLSDFSLKTRFPEYDYLSLQPGEFEILLYSFNCSSPGVYLLKLDVPYKYVDQAGSITVVSPPRLICPKSFSLWESNGYSYVSYVGEFTWNGNSYTLVH